MPKIPERGERIQVASRNPGSVRLPSGGSIESGVASIGRGLTDLAEARSQAEANDYALRALEDQRKYVEGLDEAEKGFSEDLRELPDYTKTQFDEIMERAREEAPNDRAWKAYQSKMEPFRQKRLLDSTLRHRESKTKVMALRLNKVEDDAKTFQITRPDKGSFWESHDQILESIQGASGTLISQSQLNKRVETFQNGFAVSHFEGLLLNDKPEIALAELNKKASKSEYKKGLKELNKGIMGEEKGEHPKVSDLKAMSTVKEERTIASLLTPEAFKSLYAKALQKMKTKQEKEKLDLSMRFENAERDTIRSGSFDDPSLLMEAKRTLTPRQYAEKSTRLEAMARLKKTEDTLYNTPIDQLSSKTQTEDINIEKFINDNFPNLEGSFGTRVKDFAKQKIALMVRETKKEMIEDPASAALKSSQQNQELFSRAMQGDQKSMDLYAHSIKAKQKALKIQEKLLPNSVAKDFGSKIKTAKTSEDALTIYNQVGQIFGKHSSEAMSEIVKEGKLSPEYQFISFFPDNGTKKNLIDSLRNPEIIKSYEASSVTAKSKLKTAPIKINKKLGDFFAAVRRQVPGGADAAMETSWTNLIVKSAARNSLETNHDLDESIDQITETIQNNYMTLESGNSIVYSPKVIDGVYINEDHVEAAINSFKSPEAFRELGVSVNIQGSLEVAEKKKRENGFYDRLSRSSFWVTSPDQTGMVLMNRSQTGEVYPLLDSSGKSIKLPFKEITTLSSGVDEKYKKVKERIQRELNSELQPEKLKEAEGLRKENQFLKGRGL